MADHLLLPVTRLERWTDNFADRHGTTSYAVVDGWLRGSAADGSTCRIGLPFGARYDGAPVPTDLADSVALPATWGVLLVRKGGFAVATLAGATTTGSKVGSRHVQGRTKAGGQSQQRFARRRDNQARQANEAAADHAARILLAGAALEALVTGGDRSAVESVLEDQRLCHLAARVVPPWLPVPDPRRAVLERAIADAQCLTVEVTNAD